MSTLVLNDLDRMFDGAFDIFISELMAEWEVPGVAIAIAPYGNTAPPLFKSYGVAYGDQPVTPQTRFPICSLQKPLTALTLFRTLDSHSIGHDTPIGNILPGFALQNETADRRVTVTHALCMVLGIETADVMYTDPAAQNDMIGYLSTLPCSAESGAKFIFSNYMYDIAARVIEKLDGRPYAQVVQEDVFGPLGMVNTSFNGVGGEDFALGHISRLDDGRLVPGQGIQVGTGPETGIQSLLPYGMTRGSFSLISTSEDMVKWLSTLSSNEYIPSLTTPRLLLGKTTYPGYTLHDKAMSYGMGLFQASHAGVAFSETYGATAGYRNNLAIIPEMRMSIVVLANSEEAIEFGALVKIWAIRKGLGLSMEEVMPLIRKERADRHLAETANFRSVPGIATPPDCPIGTFIGPGLGKRELTSETYVSTRPECTNIPYLPWLYGACTPVFTPTREGYEGCVKWAKGDGTVLYGRPFFCKVVKEEIHIPGPGWGERGDMCVLRRV